MPGHFTLNHLLLLFAALACRQLALAYVWSTAANILVNERLDPVVSPNALASHMHTVIGGSNFGAPCNYADAIKSSCTSFPISIDKSNYWMPELYWINNNGSSFTPLGHPFRVYYFRDNSSPNDVTRPFPQGLRMLAGNPNSKASTPVAEFIC